MKVSKVELFKNFNETGEHTCPYCLRSDFSCVDTLAEHIQVDHQVELEDMTEELGKIGLENKEVLDTWEKEQKLKILSEAYEKEPEKFNLYQKDDMALDRAVRDRLFKEALSVTGRGLTKLDAMFLRSMPLAKEGQCPDGYCLVDFGDEKRCITQSAWNAYNQYKAKPFDFGQSHRPDAVSGQSDTTIPEPISPEAEKVLDKKTPVNKVRFEGGKLILEPEYEPQRLPRNVIKYSGNREDLSEPDRKRLETWLVLEALLRHKKRSN